MFGMGFSEILIIAAIALIFLGPEKFPEFAKLAVRTVRDLRSYMDDVKSEISKEMRPVSNELKQLSKYDPEKYIDALSPKKTDEKKTDAAESTDATPEATGSPAQPAEGAEPYRSGDSDAETAAGEATSSGVGESPAPAPSEDGGLGDDRREGKFPD